MGLGALATRLGATALKQAVALTARAALAAARKMAQKLFTSARAVSARKAVGNTVTSPAFQANRVMRGAASINDYTARTGLEGVAQQKVGGRTLGEIARAKQSGGGGATRGPAGG